MILSRLDQETAKSELNASVASKDLKVRGLRTVLDESISQLTDRVSKAD